MFFFKTYLHTITRYDLINTFFYCNIKQIPKLKGIVLNFGFQKSNLKYLISGLVALEFISFKKSKLTRSKHLNIFLKIKKGNPVGCKVILKKDPMFFFYLKLITRIFPKIKQFQTDYYKQNFNSIKSVSIKLENTLLFTEIENQYQFFKNIPSLDITLLLNSKSQNELFFLLKSIKFFT